MNVSCPQCKTVFRVDPHKVPSGGARARCSVCGGVFEVQADGAGKPAPAMPRQTEQAPTPEPTAPAPSTEETPPAVEEPLESQAAPSPSTPEPGAARGPTEAGPERRPMPEGPAVGRAAATEEPAAPDAQTAPPRPAPSPGSSTEAGDQPAEETRTAEPVFGKPDPEARSRRLARALISDMVAYHPERQQVGLREGRLKELFREEIKKAWREYVEQVGLETAKKKPYFRDALNEILARGSSVF